MSSLDLWEEAIELPHGYRWNWHSALDILHWEHLRAQEQDEEEEDPASEDRTT